MGSYVGGDVEGLRFVGVRMLVTDRVLVGVGVSWWSGCWGCERNESAPSSGLQSELTADEADSAADRLSFRDDWEGERDRAPIPEGVPPLGDEDSEVPELNEAAKLCMLSDLDSLAFSRDNRVTCALKLAILSCSSRTLSDWFMEVTRSPSVNISWFLYSRLEIF